MVVTSIRQAAAALFAFLLTAWVPSDLGDGEIIASVGGQQDPNSEIIARTDSIRKVETLNRSELNRWIVPSYRRYGRVLAVRSAKGEIGEISYYSEEHLVVDAGSIDRVDALVKALSEAGLDANQPYVYSPLVYVRFYAETPEDMDLVSELSIQVVGLQGNVSLDRIYSSVPTELRFVDPNDPQFNQQWNLEKIRCPEAWAITKGNSAVIVAVIDTGLSGGDSEYEGRIVPGYNFVDENDDYSDTLWHGSLVTNVIAAKGNNGIGIAGVCWNCRILPIKVVDRYDYPLLTSKIAAAIDLAVAKGARVVNISLEVNLGELLAAAITRARNAETLIVVGAGNNNASPVNSIGRLPGVITVGSSSNDDSRFRSNWGRDLDLLAPGVNIAALGESNLAGSSFASPHVAGVAALILSLRPELTAAEVEALIYAGADDLGENGWDPETGWGRLNARNSLVLARNAREIAVDPSGAAKVAWESIPDPDARVGYRVERSADLEEWDDASGELFSAGFSTSWTDHAPVSPLDPAFYRVDLRHTPDYSPRIIRVVDPEKGITTAAALAREPASYIVTERILGDLGSAVGEAHEHGLINAPDFYRVYVDPRFLPFRCRYERDQPRHPMTERGWNLRQISESLAVWGVTAGKIAEGSGNVILRGFYETIPPIEEYDAYLTATYGPHVLNVPFCDRPLDGLDNSGLLEFTYYPSSGDLVSFDEDSLSFVARLPNDMKAWLDACAIVDRIEPLPIEEAIRLLSIGVED